MTSYLALQTLTETLSCPLKHILSSCQEALGEGHYRLDHHQMLMAIAGTLLSHNNNNNQAPLSPHKVGNISQGRRN